MSPVLLNPYRYGAAVDAYAAAVLADSPVWFAKMDDISGTSMTDYSGNGHTGTYVNSPTLLGASGVTFNAASSQYAQVPGGSYLDVTSYTIEFALKTTANNQYVISRDDGASQPIWDGFVRVAGTMAFVTFTTAQIASQLNGATTVNDGTERLIHLTRNGNSRFIHINGVQDATDTQTSYKTSTVQGIDIARRGSGSNNLTGTLRRMAFYSPALTTTRMLAHAAAM